MNTQKFLLHPHTLLNQVDSVLQAVGARVFFKSPSDKVKKAREGLVAYFFCLGLKKYTGKDWWLLQSVAPDFKFVSFPEKQNYINIEPVELTEIYPECESFSEALSVVNKKLKKYGNNTFNFSLLIFVNHEKSEVWINDLRKNLKSEHPFLSIWTVHLLFKNDHKEVKTVVAQRLGPLPGLRIEISTDDDSVNKPCPVPEYMERLETGEVKIKSEFMKKIRFGIKNDII